LSGSREEPGPKSDRALLGLALSYRWYAPKPYSSNCTEYADGLRRHNRGKREDRRAGRCAHTGHRRSAIFAA